MKSERCGLREYSTFIVDIQKVAPGSGWYKECNPGSATVKSPKENTVPRVQKRNYGVSLVNKVTAAAIVFNI